MFSKPGIAKPVGLFSVTHIIAIVMCFLLIAICVFLTRKISKNRTKFLFRIFAIVLTSLECCKIAWSWINGETNINQWVPLYFCSIFIFALWFSSSKNQKLSNFGSSYIAFAGLVCGAVFIISPSTSFNYYPIYHFLCMYSMLYHSIMCYCGIMIFLTMKINLKPKFILMYILYCVVFMTLAQTLNLIFDGNLMFINKPFGVPIRFLFNVYNYSHVLYTIIVCLSHMALSLVVFGMYKIIELIKSHAKNVKILPIEELDNECNQKHT